MGEDGASFIASSSYPIVKPIDITAVVEFANKMSVPESEGVVAGNFWIAPESELKNIRDRL